MRHCKYIFFIVILTSVEKSLMNYENLLFEGFNKETREFNPILFD